MTLRRRWYRDFLDDLRRLIHAGMPVRESLETIATGGRGLRAQVARTCLERLSGGATLAEALGASGEVPAVDAALVEAGERSGTLDIILERVVKRLDARAELVSKLRQTCAYPVLLIVACVSLVPLSLLVGGGVATYFSIQACFYIPIVAAVALAVCLPEATERLLLRTPWAGGVLIEAAVGKAMHLLGLMVQAGLPIGDAIPLAAGAARWPGLRRAMAALEPKIRGGMNLAQAFASTPVLASRPEWTARVAVAEKTGDIDHALQAMGEEAERHAWDRAGRVLQKLPWVVIPAVGTFVLFQYLKVISKLYGDL